MQSEGFVLTRRRSLQHQLFATWCAPIFTVGTLIGFMAFAHFYAPAHADLSPAQASDWFVDHRDGVLLGMSIWIVATCFLGVWTAQLGLMVARMERGTPIGAACQIIGGAGVVVIVIIDAALWIGAAYRSDADGQVVQALSDAAWLSLVIAWPILSLQMLGAALVTVRDKEGRGWVPMWLSKYSIGGAVLLFTAGGPAFAMSGAFAYHGFLGYYLPFAIWGAWLDAHAWYMRREIRRQMAVEATLGEIEQAPAEGSRRAFEPEPAS